MPASESRGAAGGAGQARTQTLAKGVETRRKADFLLESGCSAMQGHYFSKPMPVASFEQLVDKMERA